MNFLIAVLERVICIWCRHLQGLAWLCLWSSKRCMSLTVKLCRRVCAPLMLLWLDQPCLFKWRNPLVVVNIAFPFRRSKILRGMKCAVSILETLNRLVGGRELSESLNEYVMQHQLWFCWDLWMKGLEVQRSVWATLLKLASPLLSLHPNVDIKCTHLLAKWQMDMRAGSELAP